jgi:hypothetical protein
MEINIPLIALLFTAVGGLIALLTFNKNRDKDVRTDATESAVIRTKLDNIYLGVDSIRTDMKDNANKVDGLSERIIRVEESSKQAHKRIDVALKEKGDE